MGERRRAREHALEMLYELEIKKAEVPDVLVSYWGCKDVEFKIGEQTKDFAEEIVTGVIEHLEEIDKEIGKKLTNWNFERIGKVEKNILRLGLYEMLYMDNIPYIVSINEAVEIAKKYGAKDADRFVNGVLDNIRKSMNLNDE